MLANAIKPTFGSTPDENLAAPDVYGLRSSGGTINESSGGTQPGKLSEIGKSLLGSSVKPITASELGNIKYPTVPGLLNGLPKVNVPSLPALSVPAVNKASSLLGNSSVGNIKNLTGSAAGIMAKALTAVTPMIVQNGGISKVVDGIKSGNANVIGGVINSLTKAPVSPMNFKDPKALVGSVVGLVTTSSKLGIPNTLPNVISGLTTGKKDMANITSALLPIAAKTTDIPMLNTLANKNPQGALLAIAPTALSMVSSQFKKPTDNIAAKVSAYTPPQLPVTTLNNITSTFSSVDNNWNFGTKEGSSTPVPNVSVISAGSNDFKETIKAGAMASTEPLDKNLLLGTMFPSTNNDSAAIAKLQNSNSVAAIGSSFGSNLRGFG